MTIAHIETLVQQIAQKSPRPPADFLFDLLAAFDTPRATIARLKQPGGLNLSKTDGEIIWKKKLWFKPALPGEDLPSLLDALKKSDTARKHQLRFLIVADENQLAAFDTKNSETLETAIAELPATFDFFLPIAGMERAQYQAENPADQKAAEKMGKLFDQILKDNPTDSPENTHALNVFFSRLLFCFFAEDTGIFPEENQFTHALESHTQPDGSDLAPYLDRLFQVLDTPTADRAGLPNYLSTFPYVNGGLFRHRLAAPVFSRKSRQILLDCGGLDWAAINPDIFGSMIQAVVHPDQRGGLGMHYTSVPNILKVIRPLFLDELLDEFQAAKGDPKRLRRLHQRISKIRVFDPACGSGNFLIIAYKELRLLEMLIFREFPGELMLSDIQLSHFYGIELDDFAHEIATLSLWLAEHQMNQAFLAEFGRSRPALPLLASGNIAHGNATRLDWRSICPPPTDGGEVFVLGNPPYLGASLQSDVQKEDMAIVFKGIDGYKNLDYIACWFLKAADFIQNQNAQFAFVSTNSICQGEQVALLWKPVFSKNLEIGFAHTSFKWANNAKANAAVIVIVVGVRNAESLAKKYLFQNETRQEVKSINPYLSAGSNIVVEKRNQNLSGLPQMDYGTKPTDGGNLILNADERKNLLEKHPSLAGLIKSFIGSEDYINAHLRYCVWIEPADVESVMQIPEIKKRIEAVEKMRLGSPKKATRELAKTPFAFGEIRYKPTPPIIIPIHSAERRLYIPIGFLHENTVVSNAAFCIYDAAPWVFAVLTSRMHMAWVRAVCGRLKTDYRYSAQLCYNTYPLPPLTDAQKSMLQKHTYAVLAAREEHPEKTLAEIYDPEKMPETLRAAHRALDAAVEGLYRARPFETDEERLEHLFRLYETMLAGERVRGTLFAGAAEKGRRKKPKTDKSV